MIFWIVLIAFLLGCSPERETYKLAVLISGDSRKDKVEGFKAGLKDLGLSNVEYEIFEGNNTLSRMRELAREIAMRQEEFDLILAGGSIEAYMIKEASGNLKTPVVILGGTSIKEWGLTKSLDRPSENITGVDNLNAPLMEKRMEIFAKIFPEIKKVLVFCTPQFEASKHATRIAVRAGKKYGIKVVPIAIENVKDLEYVISHMKQDGFGAIVITPCFYTENFLTSYILHYANFYNVPVFCPSPSLVKKGCHVAYGTYGYDQGYQASHIAYKILRGTPVEYVPFERAFYPVLAVNESALTEIGYPLSRTLITLADEVIR